MTVKELIQAEIEKMPEEKLKEVYHLIKQFNSDGEKNKPPYHDLDYTQENKDNRVTIGTSTSMKKYNE